MAGALAAVAVGGLARRGEGQATETVRLRYDGDAACPDRDAFVAQVLARTPRVRFVEREDEGRVIAIVVRAGEGRSTGTLSAAEAAAGPTNGQRRMSAAREVSAPSCADVVSALALVTALTIDPRALTTSLPAAPSASASASNVAVQPPSAGSAAVSSGAPLLSEAEGSETLGTSTHAERPPPSGPSFRLFGDFGAGLAGSIGTQANPLEMLGPSVWFEAGGHGGSAFAPSLRVAGRYGTTPTLDPGSGAARFHLWAGRLELRAIRFETGRVALVPYIGLEVGSLVGSGEATGAIVAAREQQRTWLLAAVGGALEFTAAGPLFLTVAAELGDPLNRYRFVFQQPDLDIVSVSSPLLTGALGVGARFR
jgi:hypothetical protein